MTEREPRELPYPSPNPLSASMMTVTFIGSVARLASSIDMSSATFANPPPLDSLGALRIVNAGVQDGAAEAFWRRRLPSDASDEEQQCAHHEAHCEEKDPLPEPGPQVRPAFTRHVAAHTRANDSQTAIETISTASTAPSRSPNFANG
jgi:hypothetical protein